MPDLDAAFHLCKDSPAKAVRLAHSSAQAVLSLTTDPLDIAIAAVRQNPSDFTVPQRHYNAYDRELFAVYEVIKYFRDVLVKTNHKPLTNAFRHLDFIGHFTTDTQHISSNDHDISLSDFINTMKFEKEQKWDEGL